jgi:hypothetical protein
MEGRPGHWARRLDRPISLARGAKLVTLMDARALILSLPEASRRTLYWQYALALLTEAAQDEQRDLNEVHGHLSRALRAEGLL